MESWQGHWSSFVMLSIFFNFFGWGGVVRREVDVLNIFKFSCPFY